jgi:hypothetical protein
MWDRPGPFVVREPFPADPPITSRVSFAAALDVALPHLDAGDELLGAAGRTIETVTADGLDDEYAITIVRAADLDFVQTGGADDQVANVLTFAGAGVDVQHDSSLRYLPPVGTPIPGDFVEPPPPPTPSAPPTSDDGQVESPTP